MKSDKKKSLDAVKHNSNSDTLLFQFIFNFFAIRFLFINRKKNFESGENSQSEKLNNRHFQVMMFVSG